MAKNTWLVKIHIPKSVAKRHKVQNNDSVAIRPEAGFIKIVDIDGKIFGYWNVTYFEIEEEVDDE